MVGWCAYRKAETAYCSGQQQHKQGIVTASIERPMLRRLSLGLLASAISVASLPAIAQEDGGADDLGVMSISLKDVVKPTLVFKVHCKEQEHQTKPVLVGSCLFLLARTACSLLMCCSMSTLLTEQARAASSTQKLLVELCPLQPVLVIAG